MSIYVLFPLQTKEDEPAADETKEEVEPKITEVSCFH